MTDRVHTPGGDYPRNGQAVSFAFDRATVPLPPRPLRRDVLIATARRR